jgi:hypothetical protein
VSGSSFNAFATPPIAVSASSRETTGLVVRARKSSDSSSACLSDAMLVPTASSLRSSRASWNKAVA